MNLPIQWTPERIVKQHQAARPNATLGRELPRLDACLKKWVSTKDTNAAGKTLLLCFALVGRFKSPTAELIGKRIIAAFDGRETDIYDGRNLKNLLNTDTKDQTILSTTVEI